MFTWPSKFIQMQVTAYTYSFNTDIVHNYDEMRLKSNDK